MSDKKRTEGLGTAARLTALASSVMDLHVRIALQEVDRDKRRLISGGLFLAMGGAFMIFALLATEVLIIIWTQNAFGWSLELSITFLAVINLVLAGISLRVGGNLAKGPYLRETLDGISKTTKAVFGRPN